MARVRHAARIRLHRRVVFGRSATKLTERARGRRGSRSTLGFFKHVRSPRRRPCLRGRAGPGLVRVRERRRAQHLPDRRWRQRRRRRGWPGQRRRAPERCPREVPLETGVGSLRHGQAAERRACHPVPGLLPRPHRPRADEQPAATARGSSVVYERIHAEILRHWQRNAAAAAHRECRGHRVPTDAPPAVHGGAYPHLRSLLPPRRKHLHVQHLDRAARQPPGAAAPLRAAGGPRASGKLQLSRHRSARG